MARRFWFPLLVTIFLIFAMIILSTSLVPLEWRVDSSGWAVIFPLAYVSRCTVWAFFSPLSPTCRIACGCHILFPVRMTWLFFVLVSPRLTRFFCFAQIVLNPWLMIFSY